MCAFLKLKLRSVFKFCSIFLLGTFCWCWELLHMRHLKSVWHYMRRWSSRSSVIFSTIFITAAASFASCKKRKNMSPTIDSGLPLSLFAYLQINLIGKTSFCFEMFFAYFTKTRKLKWKSDIK